jgi:hypothetical protein
MAGLAPRERVMLPCDVSDEFFVGRYSFVKKKPKVFKPEGMNVN